MVRLEGQRGDLSIALGLFNMSTALSLGPRSLERPADAGHTLVGVLDSSTPAKVDTAGLVQLHGADWSLDWWIGADDRWYLPAREATIRQKRLSHGPVVETAMRIPSGDAKQRTYAATISGRQVIVLEVENDSPVPVALGLAIRPYGLDGDPKPMLVSLVGETLAINGTQLLRLPREPNEFGRSASDIVDTATQGRLLTEGDQVVGSPNTGVVLYPLPHRTTLRFVLDVGAATPGTAVPGPDDVAKGWSTIIDRGGRFSFPDPGLTQQAGVARSRLLSSAATLPRRVAALEPGSGQVLEALALSGAVGEILGSLGAVAGSFVPRLPGSASDAAAVVAGVGRAARLADDQPMAEALLEPLTQLTYLVEKSGDHASAKEAFQGLARLLFTVDQPEPAADLLRRSAEASQKDGNQAGPSAQASVPGSLDELTRLAEEASASGSWGADDEAAAARFWLGARSLLIDDQPSGIRLLPLFPHAWKGGQVEVHGAATSHGLLSFGIRWHGYRPALLWDLECETPVSISCPGLDPTWSTTEARGETLLVGSPEDLPDAPEAGESFQ